MLRRFSSLPTLLIAAALIATQAMAAQRSRKAEEPPPPPPQFHVDVATKIIAIQRLAINVPVGSAVGKLTKNCGLFSEDLEAIYSDNAFRGVPESNFMAGFTEEAAQAGYRQGNQQAGNLFDTPDASKAEIIVGAAILSLKEDACFDEKFMRRNEYNASATAVMTVDWQVYDPLAKKLLFRVTTEGHGNAKLDSASRTITVDAARLAFKDAARVVLAQPGFLEAVKDPNGGPVAPPNGALFPEATTPVDPTSAPTANPPAPAASAQPAALPSLVSIPTLPAGTKPFSDQAEDLRKQVVTILTPCCSGSGFYIGDGTLLTNQHVVDGYSKVKVRFLDGREVDGKVFLFNAKRDVALVQTEKLGIVGLPLHLEMPALTSRVFVIGSPLGQQNEGTVSSGIISAFRDTPDGPQIQSDAAITHGNSGGPMFDDKGNVIAITVATRPDPNTGNQVSLNMFIPIADALKTLGIGMSPTSPTTAAAK